MALDDMFLKIEGARQGPINGGSIDKQHTNEIDVLSWSWGLSGNVNNFDGKVGRMSMGELEIHKQVDPATTGLMSALRTNESLKKAVLAVRKAGGGATALEYFRITMEKARITSVTTGSAHGDGPGLIEKVTIGFQKVRVEYQGQTDAGASKGASTFETDLSDSQ